MCPLLLICYTIILFMLRELYVALTCTTIAVSNQGTKAY